MMLHHLVMLHPVRMLHLPCQARIDRRSLAAKRRDAEAASAARADLEATEVRLIRGGSIVRGRSNLECVLEACACVGACNPVHRSLQPCTSEPATQCNQAREWAACWRRVQPMRLLRAIHPSAVSLVRGDEDVVGQLHSCLRRQHAMLEGAHRHYVVAAAHWLRAEDGSHAAEEKAHPAAAHACSRDAREAPLPAMGMSAAAWVGFAYDVGLHAFLQLHGRGDGGGEQTEAARGVHAQVLQPYFKRLQPCAAEAATLCIRGCNPVHQRLQPAACRCYIGAMCAHTERRSSLGRPASHVSSRWPSLSRCGCTTAPLHSACSPVVAAAL